MKKILTGVIALIIVIFVIWNFYEKNPSVTEVESFKIGAILPITGAGATYGENQRNAILLAVKEINGAGGVNGKNLELIIEDDHTDPKTTVTSAQKLIHTDGVRVIIGGVWNHLAEAVIPVINKSKVVLISPTVSADSLTSKSPYAFFTFPIVAANSKVFEQFLSKYKNSKVAIMVWNNTWGTAHSNEFKKAITKSDSVLVKEIIMPYPDNNDVRGQLTLLKSLNPDIIFTALNFGDAQAFSKIRSEFGIRSVAFNHYNLASAYLSKLINIKDMEGFYFFRPAAPSHDFLERYKREYATEPNIPDADSAYDAVYVIKLALENNGGKYTSEDIIVGLRKITNYRGASGLIDYSINNWPENKVPYLEVFKGGQFSEVQ